MGQGSWVRVGRPAGLSSRCLPPRPPMWWRPFGGSTGGWCPTDRTSGMSEMVGPEPHVPRPVCAVSQHRGGAPRRGGGGRGVQKMLSCPLRFIVCSLGIQQMLSNQRRLLTVNAFNMTQPPPPSTLPPQWSLWSVRSQSGELCATGPVVFKALTPVRGFRGV